MATEGSASCSLIIDVSGRNEATAHSSVEHLDTIVSSALTGPDELGIIEQLKVIGAWVGRDNSVDQHSHRLRVRSISRVSESDTHLLSSDSNQEQDETGIQTEKEWIHGVKTMKELIGNLPNLYALEWIAGLPFSKKLWPAISPRLRHLTVDLTICSPREAESYKRQAVFQHAHLKPLCDFRGLETLRIQGMVESYQQIIWQAVFCNRSIHRLEMCMAQEPLCRNRDDREVWPRIEKSLLKTEGGIAMASEYRGYDGSGYLHHQEGHGEYLDIVAIRKARIAAGLVDSVDGAILPLRTLRLEGFVVDALPFARGFDNLERLDFLRNCFDAGFALPEELRRVVRVTTVVGHGEGVGDEEGRTSKVFSQDEVQVITETLGELSIRRKSVPADLYKLGREEGETEEGMGTASEPKARPTMETRRSYPSNT